MDPALARARFATARVARLATVGADGAPHLVPVVFAVAENDTDNAGDTGDDVWTAIDAKPKDSPHPRRLRNIAQNNMVSLLVDHYEEDWSQLWWVRADGEAEIVSGWPEAEDALLLLCAKYPQYQDNPPPGPVVRIHVHHWLGWSATE
ncbi:PPOX class probable F420-dependent enzyme, Rv0121 family [Streptoalloteichus hindustanus]|uniref:PPOX class probable F420-dependent enzyme, Rv0121 family n=2 Tax=Streptoalloteichus hindustanus TaxID=2017 RepID=A0A1M4VXM8_STRHI|nr:PPOX class probable F420-dependent enzyme, Rv0121 family [Streptoalloteichus hindustanus]